MPFRDVTATVTDAVAVEMYWGLRDLLAVALAAAFGTVMWKTALALVAGALVVPGGGATGYPLVGPPAAEGVRAATELPPPLQAVPLSATIVAASGSKKFFMTFRVVLADEHRESACSSRGTAHRRRW